MYARRKLCFIIICLSIVGSSFAQKNSSIQVEFGFIDRFHKRIVDTYLINESTRDWNLLRWDNEQTIDLRVSSRKVAPGDSLFVRMKLNPTEEGSYSSQVKFIFGEHEHDFKIKANVRFLDLSSNTPCPDFEKSAQVSSDWKAGFKVIDMQSKETLAGVDILLKGMKGEPLTLTTGRDGTAESELPMDYYSLNIRKMGYASYQLETYINKHQNSFVLELTPGGGSVVIRRPGSGLKVTEEAPKPSEEPAVEEVAKEQVKPSVEQPLKPKTEFDAKEFKLNNITFLIDVSTSMRQGHKMDILKESLNSLVEMLRPEDRVTFITYASKTDVLASGLSGGDKDALKTMISELKAEGLTAGEAGLKKAYGHSKKHFIDQGNNQVFLITDGALQTGYDKVTKMADSQSGQGIHLSVIAIDARGWAEKQMKTLAESGQGSYIGLDSKEEASLLLKDSIKEQSRIKP